MDKITNGAEIDNLVCSNNPLERVKGLILTRIATLEEFPSDSERDRHRLEAFALVTASIDAELDRYLAERVSDAFDEMESRDEKREWRKALAIRRWRAI